MKILIATGIYPPEIGGPATYTKTIEEALPEHGFEVNVLPFCKVRYFPKILRHIIYFFLVLWYGRSAEVIFAQDPVSVGLPSILAAKLLRKRFLLRLGGDYAWEQARYRYNVTDTLDDFVQKHEYPFMVRLLRFIQEKVARSADGVVVISEYLKRIVTTWGVDSSRMHLIYNGPNTPSIPKQINKENQAHIVSVGRLVPWKGFDGLIEALSLVRKTIPNATLEIIGSGDQRRLLEDEAKRSGVEEYVTFTNALKKPELYHEMIKANIFVLNSSFESFANVVLEAMTLGLPVVVSDAGSNPEQVTHKKNGLVVPVADNEALAGAISYVLENEAVAQAFVEAGYATTKKFSKEQMVRGTIKLLRS